jgi:uncharacterized protein
MKDFLLKLGIIVVCIVVVVAVYEYFRKDLQDPIGSVLRKEEDNIPEEVTPTLLKIGVDRIKLRVADSPEERESGLSMVPSLPQDEALLFDFGELGFWGIWMKDMKFAIDIIWLDDAFRVVYVEQAVAPETFPNSYTPRTPAAYVLEANAGFADKYSIKQGTVLDIQ